MLLSTRRVAATSRSARSYTTRIRIGRGTFPVCAIAVGGTSRRGVAGAPGGWWRHAGSRWFDGACWRPGPFACGNIYDAAIGKMYAVSYLVPLGYQLNLGNNTVRFLRH